MIDAEQPSEGPNTPLTTEWDEPRLHPDEAILNLSEPRLTTVRRSWVIGVVVVALLAVGGSVVFAMANRSAPKKSERELMQPRTFGSNTARVPDSIRMLDMATEPATATPSSPPSHIGQLAPPAGDTLPVTHGPIPPIEAADEDQLPTDPNAYEPQPRFGAYPANERAPDRDETSDEADLPSVVSAKDGQRGVSQLGDTPSLPQLGLPNTSGLAQSVGQLGQLAAALQAAQGGEDDDSRKEAFASKGGIETLGSDEEDLAECDISAGRPIPATILVATNSDIPAKNTVTAKVSQTVYCGADRQHVAIPQGSTFVGSVDARVVYGQERVQLCMHQLERPPSAGHPTGSRKQLGCFVVADITGQTGMPADVDNHWSQLIAGALLSTVLSLGTTASMGNQQGFAATTAQNAAHSAGQNINQVGQKVVQRDLQRKPTLKTEQLEGVAIIFTSNLELDPWKPRSHR